MKMKYDPSQKLTRGAKRTLYAFSETMFNLLGEKPFDKISVNELCQEADYPRATFYNYFDDKYDLLTYCWYRLRQEVKLDSLSAAKSSETFLEAFAQIYNVFDTHRELLVKVVAHNPLDSPLVFNFTNYFTGVFSNLMAASDQPKRLETPMELVAQHYSTTVLLILEWIFLAGHHVSLKTAEAYAQELLAPTMLKALA
ncbi:MULTISPECIES: TetR/AcrR family transcriptional regulator [Lacticaseibacillus]|uniref:TetR/AcrR family transcriptional regulator n=2 Tax=Lacticaseibacillus TaxID=2759736 RepID=A0ABW4CVJ7_9LACO|nr:MULTISPECIES: TetR/AcrR family transcriptional regulator [Lacticaseibacillus]